MNSQNADIMITVFTPTYNRAYSLPRLYDSLKAQTFRDFEWLIIDDGSTDDTERVVSGWKNEDVVQINYVKQSNGGKHRAINHGVKEAKGELFFIVDSDDWLPANSLEETNRYYLQIKDDNSFVGVAGSKCYPDGRKVGGEVNYEVIDTDFVTFREKLHIKGDMEEVWKTEIFRRFPFPEFEGEKFLTEAFVWNKIAKKYKLRYFNKNIYTCEYLPDGLTNNIRIHHRNSPRGTMLFYSELTKDNRFSWVSRMKAAANYWRYTVNFNGKRYKIPFWANAFFPIGFLFYLIDKNKENK